MASARIFSVIYGAQNLNTLPKKWRRKKKCISLWLRFRDLNKTFSFLSHIHTQTHSGCVSIYLFPPIMCHVKIFLNTWYNNHTKIFHYITWFNHKKNDLSINGNEDIIFIMVYMYGCEKPWWSSKMKIFIGRHVCLAYVGRYA